jgi:L-ascorbate metabolism protein UlaG (beta-lactamase superfamily)
MKVKVTYINHSGFLLEWDKCYFLFDYYNGQIPDLDKDKMLVVYVSHGHGDHFNPEIFDLYKKHPKAAYLISSDIKLDEKGRQKYGVGDELAGAIRSVKPYNEYELFDEDKNKILIKTLKSTDSGVAFVINYCDKTIYHAGDLNLWMWPGETKEYNNNMKAMYDKEMAELKDRSIDIAFAPLDPRQEDWYLLGLDKLLDSAYVRYVFPMHFWDKPEVIQKYKKEARPSDKAANNDTIIMDIPERGQGWSLDI